MITKNSNNLFKQCFTIIGLSLTLPFSTGYHRNIRDEKPNFVIINIDDLGYGDIEPFGSTLNHTPNLIRMAEEGCKLTSFYGAPVCSASRASLMTGCYPKRVLGIAQNVLYPGDSIGLSTDEITIAEILKIQGYSTGIIGKWHLGDQPEFLPTNQGFDYYYGIPYSNDMGPILDGARNNLSEKQGKNPANGHIWAKGYPPIPLLKNKNVIQKVSASAQQEIVVKYTNEAIDFIKHNCNSPFFLYLAHTAVHWPLYPGSQFHGKSCNGLYGDWVQEIDFSVGEIFKTLRSLNLSKNTLVIFTSDNGGAKDIGLNSPLRGHKGTTWEGGLRVPTIVWWPGKILPGIFIDEVCSMMDILPTLTRLADGEIPVDRIIDGNDIWPVLSGEPGIKPPNNIFYYYRGLQLQAIRFGEWKLHLENSELYNLKQDIGESKNLAGDYPEIVNEILFLAEQIENDLGKGISITEGLGPGCRQLGKVTDAKLIIDHNGKIREDF